ncbi:M-phase inducer phosphatase 1-B-like [Bombina bombina]|uniref:M-phase inducer phosphatase 1-B-like n=1 Tax=Bombina bombina TaxID=8345 RepID=UPI00235AD792|nr:M-phase inducer phosphatase 1-B-like [Bombina bombina]
MKSGPQNGDRKHESEIDGGAEKDLEEKKRSFETAMKKQVCDISPKNNYAGSEDDDLIGDFSKPYCLPVERGKYEDLKYITCSTLAHLLAGEHNNITQEYQVVDCRYPYEYAGGHIKGACNAFREEQLTEIFLKNPRDQHNKTVLIFHCEFSSKRAPKLCRRLRNMDRNVNAYPHLYYPELYILNGGYKEFYEQFKSLCEPQGYVSMIDKDFSDQLKQYHRYGNPLGTRRIRKALFKTPSPNKSTKSLSKHKLSKNTENK